MQLRQPVNSINIANGPSAPIAPSIPIVTSNPVNNANFSVANQLAANFIVPTAANAAPKPINSLVVQAMNKLSVNPKAMVLTAHITVAIVNILLGPNLSINIPHGNCIGV